MTALSESPPSRLALFLAIALFPPRGIWLLWYHPLFQRRILWWTHASVSIAMWILIPAILFSTKPTEAGSAQSGLPSAANTGCMFDAAEWEAIRRDTNLRLAHELGYLNHEKLYNYTAMKAEYEQQGEPIPRRLECVCLLLMVPAIAWREAGQRSGMSQEEYREATNFILSTVEGFDSDDQEAYERAVLRHTGGHPALE